MGRIVIHRMLAVAGTLVVAALMWVPPPAVALESTRSCIAKCEADDEAAAMECGKIENQEQRMRCQERAHERYNSCREKCAPKGDCLERCKERNRSRVGRHPPISLELPHELARPSWLRGPTHERLPLRNLAKVAVSLWIDQSR